MMHTIINYISYLPIPLLIILIFLIVKHRKKLLERKFLLVLAVILTLASLIFTYARFVEPNIVKVQGSDIEIGFKGKVVLIADTHVGVYSNKHFLKKVVKRINSIEDVDAVVLAGDIIYYPKGDLALLLEPLRDIKYPVIAVLGNHDVGYPGPNLEKELEEALKKSNVIYLKNSSVKIGDNITFFGLGELWAGDADIETLESFDRSENLIAIAHNPDTVYEYKKNIPDLTLSGHTHGGQIRLPFIYRYFIPSKHGFNEGFYNTQKGKVFVTSGLGQTGLPFRLGVPPTIDIIQLY